MGSWLSPTDEETETQRVLGVLPRASEPVVTVAGQTIKFPSSQFREHSLAWRWTQDKCRVSFCPFWKLWWVMISALGVSQTSVSLSVAFLTGPPFLHKWGNFFLYKIDLYWFKFSHSFFSPSFKFAYSEVWNSCNQQKFVEKGSATMNVWSHLETGECDVIFAIGNCWSLMIAFECFTVFICCLCSQISPNTTLERKSGGFLFQLLSNTFPCW